MSILLWWGYQAVNHLHCQRWIRHSLNLILTIIYLGNLWRLGSLWPYPLWGKWVLSLGIALATLVTLQVLTAIYWAVKERDGEAFVIYFENGMQNVRRLKSTLKEDFWSFVTYCIYDENNEKTWKILDNR